MSMCMSKTHVLENKQGSYCHLYCNGRVNRGLKYLRSLPKAKI